MQSLRIALPRGGHAVSDSDSELSRFAAAFPSISRLSALESLSLHWDRLHPTVLKELEPLANLRSLEMTLTVMYRGEIVPSLTVFRRLNRLSVQGLAFHTNLVVYFDKHLCDYKRLFWNRQLGTGDRFVPKPTELLLVNTLLAVQESFVGRVSAFRGCTRPAPLECVSVCVCVCIRFVFSICLLTSRSLRPALKRTRSPPFTGQTVSFRNPLPEPPLRRTRHAAPARCLRLRAQRPTGRRFGTL